MFQCIEVCAIECVAFGTPRRQSAQGDYSKIGSEAPQPTFCVLWEDKYF